MGKLELQNLCFEYPEDNIPVLIDLNLTINEGEFICILGASGCGKSTLLSIIEGLRKPSSGRFLINGQEVNEPGPDRGVVFQHYSLFPWLNAKQNVEFGIKQVNKGLKKKTLEGIADSYLTKVGLQGFEKKLPAHLSGGMQQRVAIARALAMNAEILLLDEPFGAVDTKNRHNLQKLVCELHEEEKKTFIFVTHDVDEALLLADRIVFMVPKRISRLIDVDLPKPREYEQMRKDEQFIKMRRMLIDLFYENYSDYRDESAEAKL